MKPRTPVPSSSRIVQTPTLTLKVPEFYPRVQRTDDRPWVLRREGMKEEGKGKKEKRREGRWKGINKKVGRDGETSTEKNRSRSLSLPLLRSRGVGVVSRLTLLSGLTGNPVHPSLPSR